MVWLVHSSSLATWLAGYLATWLPGWCLVPLFRSTRSTDNRCRDQFQASKQVREVPVAEIRRPLAQVRSNDRAKVDALKASILEHGLLEPIDVLEVDGVVFGFSGCHRYQAHVELGMETIWCRVRVGNKTALRMHMM